VSWSQEAAARTALSNETGTIIKDWGGKVAIALAYPNSYHVGMSSLALHTLYRALNSRTDVVCERVFHSGPGSPDSGETYVSFETQRPLTDFDIVAFTISFELDYFRVVDVLRGSGIPVSAAEREIGMPLVIAGGPAVSANPMPLSALLDAVAIGEGEPVLDALVDAYADVTEGRQPILEAWSKLPGMYVPAVHSYDQGAQIQAQRLDDLSQSPAHSCVLTPNTEFGGLYLIEIARGCRRHCRFCLAGHIYLPPRELPVDQIYSLAKEGLQHRQRIGLVSAAVSDHSAIDEIAVGLRSLGAKISVSSLRADSLSETLISTLAWSDASTLTIAPEAGCEKLRTVIGKDQTEDDILRAADLASHHGFRNLKLYFMLGHPGETDDDMEGIVELVRAVRGRFSRRISANLTPFVPKAHTPFQWSAMAEVSTLKRRQRRVRNALRAMGVAVMADSPAWAAVQGVLSRGDGRIGSVLAQMETLSLPAWRSSMTRAGLDQSDYLRQRDTTESLPWGLVDPGVSTGYLRHAWASSLRQAGEASTGGDDPT